MLSTTVSKSTEYRVSQKHGAMKYRIVILLLLSLKEIYVAYNTNLCALQ